MCKICLFSSLSSEIGKQMAADLRFFCLFVFSLCSSLLLYGYCHNKNSHLYSVMPDEPSSEGVHPIW